MPTLLKRFTPTRRTTSSSFLLPWIFMSSLYSTVSMAEHVPHSKGNQVDFSYEASAELENDLMVLTFAAISEADSSASVSSQINQKMQYAKQALKHAELESVQTSNYSVSPVYNAKREISHWRGHQTLTILAKTEKNLDHALQELQKHLAFQNMQFTLSKAKRDSAEETLLLDAIQGYQQKAKVIASGFGKQSYELLKTSIQPSYALPVARYQALEARVASATPVAVQEQGESTVSVQIRGTLRLTP